MGQLRDVIEPTGFNANAVTIEDPTFGPTWLAPAAIMPGRLAKFAFQIDF